ncbi:hypothetical protein LguiB_001861 [Lonicera macranthoides]
MDKDDNDKRPIIENPMDMATLLQRVDGQIYITLLIFLKELYTQIVIALLAKINKDNADQPSSEHKLVGWVWDLNTELSMSRELATCPLG